MNALELARQSTLSAPGHDELRIRKQDCGLAPSLKMCKLQTLHLPCVRALRHRCLNLGDFET